MSSKKLEKPDKSFSPYQVIAERIGICIGINGPSEADLARALGVSPQGINDYKNKDYFPAEKTTKFALDNKLSLDYLLTGKGEMELVEKFSEGLKNVVSEEVIEQYGFIDEKKAKSINKIASKDAIISDIRQSQENTVFLFELCNRQMRSISRLEDELDQLKKKYQKLKESLPRER